MWFGTAAGLRKLPAGSGRIYAGVEIVEPVSVVRNLGVWIDSELTMHDHRSRTCQSCFYHLRRLRSIRKLLGRDVTIQLVCALGLSWLDYCNSSCGPPGLYLHSRLFSGFYMRSPVS